MHNKNQLEHNLELYIPKHYVNKKRKNEISLAAKDVGVDLVAYDEFSNLIDADVYEKRDETLHKGRVVEKSNFNAVSEPKEKLFFHLKISEWAIFAMIVAVFTTLTVWMSMYNVDMIDGAKGWFSITCSWTAAVFTILGTFFLARGKRIGFILDTIAFVALGLNLMLGQDPLMALGVFYLLIPVPVTILAFALWKKRQLKGVEEKEMTRKLFWWSIFFIVAATSLTYLIIIETSGGWDAYLTNSEAGHSYGTWAYSRTALEIFKIYLMLVVTVFFVMGLKEAWTFVMVLEATNIALYSISFACSPNPNPGYFLNIWLYVVEFLVATWGAFLWYFKKVKNN